MIVSSETVIKSSSVVLLSAFILFATEYAYTCETHGWYKRKGN